MKLDYKVFCYWTGKKPPLIKLCHKLFKKHIKNIVFITDDNISDYVDIKKYNNKLDKILPAQKADIYRLELIYNYGGIWLDSDIIVFKDLNLFFNIINVYGAFFCDEEPNYLCNGFFGAKPKHPFIKEWLDLAVKKLENDNINWADLSSPIMNIIKNKYNHFTIDAYNNLLKINWRNAVNSYANTNKDEFTDPTSVIILYNCVYKHFNHSEEKLLKMDNYLGYLLRYSYYDNANK